MSKSPNPLTAEDVRDSMFRLAEKTNAVLQTIVDCQSEVNAVITAAMVTLETCITTLENQIGQLWGALNDHKTANGGHGV